MASIVAIAVAGPGLAFTRGHNTQVRGAVQELVMVLATVPTGIRVLSMGTDDALSTHPASFSAEGPRNPRTSPAIPPPVEIRGSVYLPPA